MGQYLPLFLPDHVSFIASCGDTATDRCDSICGLTIYRIFLSPTANSTNWQRFFAQLSLLTCLEALLGLVNACLPVMKPVVGKVWAFIWLDADELPQQRRPRETHIRLSSYNNFDADTTLRSMDVPKSPSEATHRLTHGDSKQTMVHGEARDMERHGQPHRVKEVDGLGVQVETPRALGEAWARW